ncbi:MAG: hypothetical protein AAGJ81_11140 [Verrucomicrobiota bacterium]
MAGILAVHLVALLIFGGMTVYEAILPDDPSFDEPPPVEKIERVQLEFKVRMQEKQKQSERPKQRLQVRQISQMDVPDVDIQVPDISTNRGIGRFGDERLGDMGGGLGLGEVSVSLFDIRAKGEKFLFVIDVYRNLMQDSKGGLLTYNVIKEDLTNLIEDLPSGVLFNIMLFQRGQLELWRPSLVAASTSNKESSARWLKGVNSGPNQIGVRNKNFIPKSWNSEFGQNLVETPWMTQNDVYLAVMGILEQRPDAVYLFTDNLPGMEKSTYRSPEDLENTEEQFRNALKRAGFDSEAEYTAKRNPYEPKIQRKIDDFKRNETEQRRVNGLPPRIYTWGESDQLRKDIEEQLEKDDDDFVPLIRRIDYHVFSEYSEREIDQVFETLLRLEYDQNSDERPVLNAIVFKGADEDWTRDEDRAADDFVDYFNGEYRILKGLGAIDSEAMQ